MSCCHCFLSILGALALFSIGIKVYKLVNQLTRSRKNLNELGKWSVVTGATSGIGEAMAHELAKRGQNVLIIGRNNQRLQDVESEIRKKSPKVEVANLKMDLAHLTEEDKKNYRACIENKDIGVLVNNAGLAYPFTQYFHEVDEELINDMIEVNNKTATWLARATLPQFLLKKKGAVVNISSAASVAPLPLHEVYGGTKAYLNKWTEDMASSYSNSYDITFQAQLPYFVVSNMSKIKKSTLLVPSASSYARAAVSQIGYSGLVSPYPLHAILHFVLSFVPSFLLEKYVNNLHHTIRKRGLSKKQGKKED